MAHLHNSFLSPSIQDDQTPPQPLQIHRKKRNQQPVMPDPEAEVVALSPNTLLATNRFVCEICGKGFQRDQNLQLHRRGHNLPWKLKQRGPIKKRVYICPEKECVHHDPVRALGDLTGIKKHFCRKHGEKKWKCERCCKKYAVKSDLKAHLKICGTREYKCDCGTIFSRRDSFVTHRAFCDALAKESVKFHTSSDGSSAKAKESMTPAGSPVLSFNQNSEVQDNSVRVTRSLNSASCSTSSISNHKDNDNGNDNRNGNVVFRSSVLAPISDLSLSSVLHNLESFPGILTTMPNCAQLSTYTTGPPLEQDHESFSTTILQPSLSATALLQKASQMGSVTSVSSRFCGLGPIPSREHVGDNRVKIEEDNDAYMAFARRFGLPSSQNLSGSGPIMVEPSAYFGPKPMTLDLLGLGTQYNDSFPAHGYLTDTGNPIDVAVGVFDEGNESLMKVSLDGAPRISEDDMRDR